MKIFMVRHGETDWNKEGRLQGRTDIPMNQHGISQMERIADYMADGGYRVDVIVSSPLQRARMSAEIIASRIGFIMPPASSVRFLPGRQRICWEEREA